MGVMSVFTCRPPARASPNERRAPPLTQSGGGGASVSKSSSSSQSAQLVTVICVCFQRLSSISGIFSASFFFDLPLAPEVCAAAQRGTEFC